ncbi:MAG: hypothetical protein AAGA84_04095 [Pseudomonadota bacterium]
MEFSVLKALLFANAVWFGMAFHAFYIRREIFGKVMVPIASDRENTAYQAFVESGRFMGGFNFALSAFNVLLLFNVGDFSTNAQWATLLLFMVLAHGSQFVGNIPMALQNRQGGGLWNVFKGVMLRIFVIDCTLMILNGALALWLLVG